MVAALANLHHDQSFAYNLLDSSHKLKEFTITALGKDKKAFILYITSFFSFDNHYKIKLSLLFTHKVFISILSKYLKFNHVFYPEFVAELPKFISIN